MATQPKRAVLHQVLTTAARSDGGSLTVAYVFDEDHDRHLVFAISPRFDESIGYKLSRLKYILAEIRVGRNRGYS